ncbi:hypothetical protein QCA50_018881 [Cerrena zonata]|uniref:Uncharacterized protein n=1 Tax=Cerrena zonata TaxID=2478898 RepID=A0AAW0FBN7_9APHY
MVALKVGGADTSSVPPGIIAKFPGGFTPYKLGKTEPASSVQATPALDNFNQFFNRFSKPTSVTSPVYKSPHTLCSSTWLYYIILTSDNTSDVSATSLATMAWVSLFRAPPFSSLI